MAAEPCRIEIVERGTGWPVPLVELGKLLFGALFQGAIKDVYVRSQGALAPEQGLRLRGVAIEPRQMRFDCLSRRNRPCSDHPCQRDGIQPLLGALTEAVRGRRRVQA